MKTELGVTHLTVRPGSTARVEIEVTNVSEVIDGVTMIVDGIDQTWIRFDAPVVSLFPSVTSAIGFTIDVPSDCPAGDYLVVARVISTIDPDRQTVHDFWIEVTPVVAYSMQLRPRVITAGSTADVSVTIVNEGNVAAPVYVSAIDRTREAECIVEPPELIVPEASTGTVHLRLRGPRPWFGQAPVRTITVAAVSEEVALEEVVTFTQKPRIPRGVLTALILAGIIALWATIFLLVVAALGRGEDPGKARASDFNRGGAENVALASIAATAQGRVTAGTNGEGVPRITVEAFRVRADGSLVEAGSGASDDDGLWTLSSLIPGNYLFWFSSDGFVDVWYPDAASSDAASPVPVGPLDTVGGLDVVLEGRPGALVGAISLPETVESAPTLTVTATLIDREDDPETIDQPLPRFVQQTTGDIVFDGLPTPGTYRIRVEGADFVPQEFEERLEGGEVRVLNTVRLGAAVGSISGRVVDAELRPLGNVVVTVSAGDVRRQVTTPTSGNVGEFTVVGLDTPNTYVLTFELDGFSGQTIALDVLAGEDRTGITALLIGGLGSVAGVVRDESGIALGDVLVTLVGNDVSSTTTTLTTGDDGGGIGSYSLSGIPVPGIYTLTFTADGYVAETIEIGFLTAGPAPATDVVLRSDSGELTGLVRGAGEPLGDVRVELSNGIVVRSTSTATSPPGRFRFGNVAPGTYTLRAEAPGFEPRVVLVRIREGDALERDIDLVGG